MIPPVSKIVVLALRSQEFRYRRANRGAAGRGGKRVESTDRGGSSGDDSVDAAVFAREEVPRRRSDGVVLVVECSGAHERCRCIGGRARIAEAQGRSGARNGAGKWKPVDVTIAGRPVAAVPGEYVNICAYLVQNGTICESAGPALHVARGAVQRGRACRGNRMKIAACVVHEQIVRR